MNTGSGKVYYDMLNVVMLVNFQICCWVIPIGWEDPVVHTKKTLERETKLEVSLLIKQHKFRRRPCSHKISDSKETQRMMTKVYPWINLCHIGKEHMRFDRHFKAWTLPNKVRIRHFQIQNVETLSIYDDTYRTLGIWIREWNALSSYLDVTVHFDFPLEREILKKTEILCYDLSTEKMQIYAI